MRTHKLTSFLQEFHSYERLACFIHLYEFSRNRGLLLDILLEFLGERSRSLRNSEKGPR